MKRKSLHSEPSGIWIDIGVVSEPLKDVAIQVSFGSESDHFWGASEFSFKSPSNIISNVIVSFPPFALMSVSKVYSSLTLSSSSSTGRTKEI